MVGRSNFFKIVRKVTGRNQRALTAVDFTVGLLVNDTCTKIENIINTCFNPSKAKELQDLMLVCRNFLKVQFDDHLLKDDTCSLHDLQYALDKDSTQQKNGVTSLGCKYVPCMIDRLIKEIRNHSLQIPEIQSQQEEIVHVIEEIGWKFRLY